MIMIVGIVLILLFLVVVYSSCVVSSRCSCEEEDSINMK